LNGSLRELIKLRRLTETAISRILHCTFQYAQPLFEGMSSRVLTSLLLTAFLLLLLHPPLVPLAQPGARSSDLSLNPLQNDLLTSSPQQEKRNEDFSGKTEKACIVVHLERFAVNCCWRPDFTDDLPVLSSALVYTQTTSSFL
jgi:hypothetical protein